MTETPLWTWRRLVAVTLAKALLACLVGLAAWGALPALIGWHPTTVSSGSMLPRLHVGDIAVSRPLGPQLPPLTSVLLFDDPDHPGRLRMHRFVRLDEAGMLVTRGDANAADDSTPVALSAVHGIGTLRVPWVALPVVWLRGGQWLFLGLVAGGLVLLLAVATSGRDRVFAEDGPPDGPGPDADGPTDDRADDPAAGPAGVSGDATPPAPQGWARPAVRRAATLLAAGLLVTGLVAPSGAAFSDTTTGRGSFGAATYFSCASVVSSLRPYLWYRMDETSSTTTTATDSSGNGRTGVYGSAGKTTTTNNACNRDTGRAMTFNGTSGYLSSPAVYGGLPDTFTLSLWFRTTSTSGGKLIGFGSAQTGQSSNYDRHVYMTDAGRLSFGVYSNGNRVVSSSSAYNNGSWHLAVATMSTAGMRLYADGRLVGSDTTTTSGEAGSTAYVRVAYDNLTFWENQPTSSYFGGSLDDAAYFTTALTATQVQSLYDAGTT
jgi:hypothetical protein